MATITIAGNTPPIRILSISNGAKQQSLEIMTAISGRLRECSIST
jgi:hypothetical protein